MLYKKEVVDSDLDKSGAHIVLITDLGKECLQNISENYNEIKQIIKECVKQVLEEQGIKIND